MGPDPTDTQGILQSPEYGQSKRGEAIFIPVGNTRDVKTIDPFVSLSPHFRSPARPNLASVLTFPEGKSFTWLETVFPETHMSAGTGRDFWENGCASWVLWFLSFSAALGVPQENSSLMNALF